MMREQRRELRSALARIVADEAHRRHWTMLQDKQAHGTSPSLSKAGRLSASVAERSNAKNPKFQVDLTAHRTSASNAPSQTCRDAADEWDKA
jgi:hypothetical protein